MLRRNEYADELVWIAPLNVETERPDSPAGAYRDPQHEYLDIRFDFYRRVDEEDIKNTAKVLSRLINEEHIPNGLHAKRIALLDKASVQSRAVDRFKDGLKRKRESKPANDALRPEFSSLHASQITASPISYESTMATTSMEGKASKIGYFQPTDGSENVPSLRKRPRWDTQQVSPQDRSSLFHFRMFLDCSLQNARTGIGRMADLVSLDMQCEFSS